MLNCQKFHCQLNSSASCVTSEWVSEYKAFNLRINALKQVFPVISTDNQTETTKKQNMEREKHKTIESNQSGSSGNMKHIQKKLG